MIKLTNVSGEKLVLNPAHVVAVREDKKQVFILTSTGVEYAVRESMEEVGEKPGWARL